MLCRLVFLLLCTRALHWSLAWTWGSKLQRLSYSRTLESRWGPARLHAMAPLLATASGVPGAGTGTGEEGVDGSITSWEQLRSALRGTNVFFIGMMGSGKTTVGKEFAKKLGYRFLDTDEVAEFMIEPVSIAEYFAAGNETQFRDLEYQILMEMTQYTRLVMSTGGGIVERNENWGLLHHGIVVFLDLPPEDVYARLSAYPDQIAKRPLLSGPSPLSKLQELSARRMDKYTQADVQVRVPPTASNNEVAILVCESILKHIENNPPRWLEWKKKRDAAMMVSGAASGVDGNILQ